MSRYAEPWLQQRLSRRQQAELQTARYDPRPEQTSGFFKLSAELRNMIYELTIVQHDFPLWITADRHSAVEDIGPGPTAPPLTQVCHLLRSETLPVYYGVNTFSVVLVRGKNVVMTNSWLSAIGDVGAVQLDSLKIRGYVKFVQQRRPDGYPWYPYITLSLCATTGRLSKSSTRHARDQHWTVDFENEDHWSDPFYATEAKPYLDSIQEKMNQAPHLGSPQTVDNLKAAIGTFATFCGFKKTYDEALQQPSDSALESR